MLLSAPKVEEELESMNTTQALQAAQETEGQASNDTVVFPTAPFPQPWASSQAAD